jgi:mercuric ion transport protein
MTDNGLLKTGVIGSLIMLVCCFTPILVIVLGGVGLSAWVAGLDWVLLPLLGAFLVLIAVAVIRRNKTREQDV